MTSKIVVLIPARNEERDIGAALDGLHAQTRSPDRVIVIANNCTDDTAAVARRHGAEVVELPHCPGKKAGALNKVMHALIPSLDSDDLVLVQDADSSLAPRFLEVAAENLADKRIGAVGGVFYGRLTGRGGLVEELQATEYVRYARQIARNGSHAYVLTGTATMFRSETLREVAAARKSGKLPAGPGEFYDEYTMTEDGYMTFAVKTLGYKTPSPLDCWVLTEVMPDWRRLWRQRRRWQLGALEDLRSFGPLTKVTWQYTARQLVAAAELIFFLAFVVTAIWSGLAGSYHLTPFWIAIGCLFWLERVVTARKAGPKAMAVAAVMLIELGYGLFLKAVNVYSYVEILRGRQVSWSLGPGGDEKGDNSCTNRPRAASQRAPWARARSALPGETRGGWRWLPSC